MASPQFFYSSFTFIYRNGCAKEVRRNIKDGKNKKWTYEGNNGIEREARHHRHQKEEKTTMVWPCQKDARGKKTKVIMDWIPWETRKRGHPRKAWMEGVQAAMITRNLEPDQWRNREEWHLVSGRRWQLLKNRIDRSHIFKFWPLDSISVIRDDYFTTVQLYQGHIGSYTRQLKAGIRGFTCHNCLWDFSFVCF